MFERDAADTALERRSTTSSPRPYEEDDELLETRARAPSRSRAYDLVCNGQEIGSGSIRIHRRERLLARAASPSIWTRRRRRRSFGHMLQAFTYGAPPHGGIALGHRPHRAALLAGERDIREVIAFPKTKTAPRTR